MATAAGFGPRDIPFRVVSISEIPTEWNQPITEELRRRIAADQKIPLDKLERYIGIEVPDFPLFWRYQQWLTAQPSDEVVSVVIVNRKDFVQSRGEEALRRTFHTLLTAGRPDLLWVHLWARRP